MGEPPSRGFTLTDELVDQRRPATGGNLWVDATEEQVTDPAQRRDADRP